MSAPDPCLLVSSPSEFWILSLTLSAITICIGIFAGTEEVVGLKVLFLDLSVLL